ncbi:MAG: hypothetical protein PHN44_05035 [Candidatus Marinimicrobia bacterium]|nr:hypothetical protein [Candidatus Neomarinimicrobiota bacterium]
MKKNNVVIVGVLIAAIISAFLFGNLFCYSPIIVGFKKIKLPHSFGYVQNRAEFRDWSAFDTLITPVEKAHQIKFRNKPQFFIFRDSVAYKRLSPSRTRFCAIPTRRIFIAPWSVKEAAAGIISLEIYLKHELSHILIYQQTGFIRAFRFPKWLLEGIAVYSANQMGTGWYPKKTETYNYIRQGNFMSPGDYKTHRAARASINVKNRAAFIYCEFACIVDYLIETHGREKFQNYIQRLFTTKDYARVFEQIYGIDFDYFIAEFRAHCANNDFARNEI